MRSGLNVSALVRRFLSGRGGNAAIIVSIVSPVIAIMAALAIDTGAIASEQRRMQGLVDIAAISGARDLKHAEKAALTALAVNGFAGSDVKGIETGKLSGELKARMKEKVSVETGRYNADPERDFTLRFEPGGSPVNAVRVRIEKERPRYFAPFRGDAKDMVVTGTAAVSSEAAVSVGSRLLSLDDGVLNTLLNELTGSDLSLSVMDYRALADADVDILQTFDALATNADLQAATYDDVLETDVSVAELASAMAAVTDDQARASAALRSVAGESSLADAVVPLSALFDLGSAGRAALGTPAEGLDLNVEALQMLTAGAMVANGENQVDLDLDGGVPGLVSIRASLLIGERPQTATWFALSENGGSVVSTAQARLFVETKIEGLDLLGHDLMRLPLYLELAPAEAQVAGVVCKSGKHLAERVDVDVTPGILTLRIADLNGDLEALSRTQRFEPASILDARLVSIKAEAHSSMVSGDARTLSYYAHDIGSGDPKTATTRDALGEALETAVRDLELEVDLVGLNLVSPRLIQNLTGEILAEAVEPVDELVFSLTSALGLGLGEADVWVHDARCNRSVLVQ